MSQLPEDLEQVEVRSVIRCTKMVKASFRLHVLQWADLFAKYVMWMMMIYITDVWKLDFTHAAAIINVWMGSELVLPLLFAHLADAFLGNFMVLLLTGLSYVLGLGLLWMSTPPVLGNSNGNCTSYKPECIGEAQKALFYTGLTLIAVGMAGREASYIIFAYDQVEGDTNQDETVSKDKSSDNVGYLGFSLAALAGILVVIFVKPWAIQYGLCALLTLVATLLFLTGVCSYKYKRPIGSPITTIFRVFVASFSKMINRPRGEEHDLYNPVSGLSEPLQHTKGIRCLDKAAMVLPNQSVAPQEQNRWRLCSVTEVEETKMFIRLIPMWLTFLICGLVSSISNTYFLEQAKHLDPKLGRIKVPLIFFFWIYNQAKQYYTKMSVVSYMFKNLISKIYHTRSQPRERRSLVPPLGIAVAMVFSVLCCITAAKVETRRLGVVESHGLIDKPEERIPMTIFWLLPQFILIGALDGIYHMCVALLFGDQVGACMKNYMFMVSEAVFGAGIMCGPLLVYIVGKISERGGKMNWFQNTLNKSRLDNYFWVLATLSAVNLILYVVIAIFYRCMNPKFPK